MPLFLTSLLNKFSILAFTRDALPDLLPFYASQIFKAVIPSQLKYCVTVLEIILEFLSENVMAGSDTYLIHALFRAIYIPYLSIASIIRDHTRKFLS